MNFGILQSAIGNWSIRTFGPIKDISKASEKLVEEAGEACASASRPSFGEELADVVIVAMNLAHQAGINLETEVIEKMRINRSRTWNLDGNGSAHHR